MLESYQALGFSASRRLENGAERSYRSTAKRGFVFSFDRLRIPSPTFSKTSKRVPISGTAASRRLVSIRCRGGSSSSSRSFRRFDAEVVRMRITLPLDERRSRCSRRIPLRRLFLSFESFFDSTRDDGGPVSTGFDNDAAADEWCKKTPGSLSEREPTSVVI